MTESVPQKAKVVKVSLATFEKFLRAQEYEYWDVDDIVFEEYLGVSPATVDEIVRTIEFYYGHDNEYIYVFDYDDPYEIANQTDWEKVPEVDAERLHDYILPSRAGDFLYFDCSLEDASNGTPITLLPAEDPTVYL